MYPKRPWYGGGGNTCIKGILPQFPHDHNGLAFEGVVQLWDSPSSIMFCKMASVYDVIAECAHSFCSMMRIECCAGKARLLLSKRRECAH